MASLKAKNSRAQMFLITNATLVLKQTIEYEYNKYRCCCSGRTITNTGFVDWVKCDSDTYDREYYEYEESSLEVYYEGAKIESLDSKVNISINGVSVGPFSVTW